MKKIKKILYVMLLIIGTLCVFKNVEATTITASSNSVKKGESVTITVSVPNVNTVDLTATVSGAGTSGTIRLVDGALTGEAKTYSKSITVTPTSTGTISVTVSSGSNAVLNGAYVNVAASKSITVTEPVVNNTTTNTNTNTNKPTTNTTTNKPATNTNTNTNKNTNTNTNKNTNTTTAKSSNANLKNMLLSVEGLTPAFSKDITTYSLTVRESVESIKVNASVEHSRASYSVTGADSLKVGENVVTVKVTAEDGTVKTYTINVLKSDEPVKSDATLSSLIIEDVDLGQTFDPNVTEYNAGDITVKANKLNIFAYANNENAKIEILGNEDLGVGEHKVTIRVTSENGKITKDYVVAFNKLYAEEVVEADSNALKEVDEKDSETAWDSIKENLKEHATVIILYLFVWVEFIQVVYLYEKLKKHEDIDKITISRRLKNLYVREIKEKPRREKVNPIFPDEEEIKEESKEENKE